jgi:hypothetical protein
MVQLEDKELLWCLVCDGKFTPRDVVQKRYFAETGICAGCYSKMKRNLNTCFGKEQVDGQYGYDPSTQECSRFCPDRKICPEYVQKR